MKNNKLFLFSSIAVAIITGCASSSDGGTTSSSDGGTTGGTSNTSVTETYTFGNGRTMSLDGSGSSLTANGYYGNSSNVGFTTYYYSNSDGTQDIIAISTGSSGQVRAGAYRQQSNPYDTSATLYPFASGNMTESLPTGTATYLGDAYGVSSTNGGLNGVVRNGFRAQVDFSNNTANIDRLYVPAVSVSTNFAGQNGMTVGIDESGRFSGSSAGIQVEGAFYGNNAEDMAGTFSGTANGEHVTGLDTLSSMSVSVNGGFIGSKQ